MSGLRIIFGRLWSDKQGVAAIEFCLTLPVLLALTLGAYDVSRMVAARMDYQQVLAEVAGLAIAYPPQGNLGYLQNAAAAAAAGAAVPVSNITIQRRVECDGVVSADATCGNPAQEQAIYVIMSISGTYVPTVAHFSVDANVPMTVNRTVRVG